MGSPFDRSTTSPPRTIPDTAPVACEVITNGADVMITMVLVVVMGNIVAHFVGGSDRVAHEGGWERQCYPKWLCRERTPRPKTLPGGDRVAWARVGEQQMCP